MRVMMEPAVCWPPPHCPTASSRSSTGKVLLLVERTGGGLGGWGKEWRKVSIVVFPGQSILRMNVVWRGLGRQGVGVWGGRDTWERRTTKHQPPPTPQPTHWSGLGYVSLPATGRRTPATSETDSSLSWTDSWKGRGYTTSTTGHTHTHTHTHTPMSPFYMCMGVCVCLGEYVWLWMHLSMCLYMYVCACMYICVHIYVYVCMHMCACMYMYVYICGCAHACVCVCERERKCEWVMACRGGADCVSFNSSQSVTCSYPMAQAGLPCAHGYHFPVVKMKLMQTLCRTRWLSYHVRYVWVCVCECMCACVCVCVCMCVWWGVGGRCGQILQKWLSQSSAPVKIIKNEH